MNKLKKYLHVRTAECVRQTPASSTPEPRILNTPSMKFSNPYLFSHSDSARDYLLAWLL